jgi:hypothetical protein
MARTLIPAAAWHNAVLFQLAWLGFVGGAVIGYPILGMLPLAAMALASWHLGGWRADLSCVLLAAGAGLLLERFWMEMGTFEYAGTSALGVPWWIIGLWAGVALTVNHSLAWLRPRPWLGAVLAAAAAPLSYGAGAQLGAVSIGNGLEWVSAAWAAAFFVLFTFARTQQHVLQELEA